MHDFCGVRDIQSHNQEKYQHKQSSVPMVEEDNEKVCFAMRSIGVQTVSKISDEI